MSIPTRTVLETAKGPASGLYFESEKPVATLFGIHGAGHAAESLAPLFGEPTLGHLDRFALDLPGRHGSRPLPVESTTDAADFAQAALEALDGPRPRIALGHSFGGAVAIELALRGAVDAVVLVSTGARLRVRPEVLATFESVARGEAERPRGVGFSSATEPSFVASFEAAFDDVPATTALADWRAADRFDRLADVGGIEIPALVVGGDDDPFTPLRYAEFFASRMPAVTLFRMNGGSHLAIVERPAEIAQEISSFVSAMTTGGTSAA